MVATEKKKLRWPGRCSRGALEICWSGSTTGCTGILQRSFPQISSLPTILSSAFCSASWSLERAFSSDLSAGILIGAYADKHGRIKALTLTILCMGVCTMLMGCLPTYSQVGILAPILLTVLRLLQGLATGGEFGSSLTFISEYGTPNNRAFLCSWQPFSVGCGLLLGSAAVCSSRRSCPKPLCTIGVARSGSFSAS